uniref:CCHC-type domain-containing protein n=1 Tax=Brassica campestris TaxID=3711 RepID=M4DB65_BRACM
MDTGLRPPVFVISPSSSPVQTSSMLTFASSMTSSTFSSALVNTISDGLKEPESSIASESNITQVSSLQDDCNPPKFVPILGAWAKPLLFKPPATPSQPSTPREYDPAIVGNQLAALWPSLNDEILNKKPKSSHQTRTLQLPIEKLPPPELKADGKVRFPWAARLSPQSRNLYRAATPTYRLDGTPQISIPSKVLKLGPENKDEYIIGKFHRCTLPPGGLVHAVTNQIWGRSCKISCKKIGESTYMFHIPHEPTRHWVIQRGIWHIDDCLLFVLPWTPEDSFKMTEISTLPLWVNLKNIPDCCYSRLGISHVASGLGEPILTHKPRLDPTTMGEAKVLVEMELDRDFPKIIALDDKQGSIFLVEVEYTWIPSKCERCGNLGHKEKRCLLTSKPENLQQQKAKDDRSDIPVVDIDVILRQRDSITAKPSSNSNPTTPKVNANHFITTVEFDDPVILDTQVLEDKDIVEPNQQLLVVDQRASANNSYHSDFDQETSNRLSGTLSPSHLQHEEPANMQIAATIPSTLVDSRSTPIDTQIMESSPSNITNNVVLGSSGVGAFTTSPVHCSFESPSHFAVLGDDEDEVEIEPSSQFSLTRGGRESKAPINYHNMEWKTVRGRGNRGRRGRSSSH